MWGKGYAKHMPTSFNAGDNYIFSGNSSIILHALTLHMQALFHYSTLHIVEHQKLVYVTEYNKWAPQAE